MTEKVPVLAKAIAMASAKTVTDVLNGAILVYIAGPVAARVNGTANAVGANAGNSTAKVKLKRVVGLL